MAKQKYEKVDLREILSEDGLSKINKGELLVFKTPEGVKTSIKVTSCSEKPGYWGSIIPNPVDFKDLTEDQHTEIHDSIVEAAKKRTKEMKPIIIEEKK